MARVSAIQRVLEERVANPLLRWLLRSPLHRLASGRLVLVSYVGSKSGRRYTFPVAYAEVGTEAGSESGESVVAVTPTSETNWWRNFRGPADCRLWLRGEEREATGEVVGAGDDPDDGENEPADGENVDGDDAVESLLRTYFEKNESLAGMLDLGGNPAESPAAMARAKRELAVVRFEFD